MRLWQIVLLCIALMCSAVTHAGKGISSGGSRSTSTFSIRSITPPPKPAAQPAPIPIPVKPHAGATGIGAANQAPMKPVQITPTQGATPTGIGVATNKPSPLTPPNQSPPPPATPSGYGASIGTSDYNAPTQYGGGYNASPSGGFGLGTAAVLVATGSLLGYGIAEAASPDVPAAYQAPPAIVQYVQQPAPTPPVVTPPQFTPPVATTQAPIQSVVTPAPANVVTTYQPITPSPTQQESNTMAFALFMFIMLVATFVAFIINRHYNAWRSTNNGDFNTFYESLKNRIINPSYISEKTPIILGGTHQVSSEEHKLWIDRFIAIQNAWFNHGSLASLLTTQFHAQLKVSGAEPDGAMPNYRANGICCTVKHDNAFTYVNYMFHNGDATEICQWRYLNLGGANALLDSMSS